MLSVLFWRGASCLLLVTCVLQGTLEPPGKKDGTPAVPVPRPAGGPGAQTPPETDAERIANARDSIKQATLAVEKLQKRLDDPQGEYKKAEDEFEALNRKLKDGKAEAAKLRKEGKVPEAVAREATLPAVEEDWKLAKERFDIAIRQKKATQETIAGLKERIASDQQLLDRLEGRTPTPAPKSGVPDVPPGSGGTTEPFAAPPTTGPAAAPPTTPEAKKPAEGPTGLPAGLVPGVPGVPLPVPPAAEQRPATPVAPPPPAAETDPVVRQAREKLDARRAELRDVQARVRAAEERVRVMERSVQNAEKMLALERESVTEAEKSAARLANTLQKQPPPNPAEKEALAQKLKETGTRLAEARTRVQRIDDRTDSLKETLAGLKSELDVVNKEAAEKKKQVEDTEAALNDLLSPTAPRNVFRWAINKGPRLLLIVVGTLLLHMALRQFSRHIVRFITRHSQRGSREDRENRASTLVGVFRYAGGLVVFGGGLVMLLDEVGVPVVPLMGGAAVVGLAVAFGAQNLIRDYFTGFMMLMEDQYSVNDVVRIGSIAGLVEQITLRMTVLRDLEGVRHFIPHGTITSVSNLTHGWSRAMMDVRIAYRENVDQVMGILMQLGRDLRRDPVLGPHILDEPEMLGVDSLGDSGVVIRFLLKTRPLQQWPIKREMLRRIKNRFDELGIEIPFPHQTVFHRYPDETREGVSRDEPDRPTVWGRRTGT